MSFLLVHGVWGENGTFHDSLHFRVAYLPVFELPDTSPIPDDINGVVHLSRPLFYNYVMFCVCMTASQSQKK
jgi:hypothetical protein